MSTSRTLHATVITLLAALAVTACQPPGEVGGTSLAALPVQAEDTGARYHRDQWGDWTTHGGGCGTREVVLRDQGHNIVPGKGCRPVCPADVAPCWVSPYDGATLDDPTGVQIDHRVPLKEAAQSGARDWTPQQRERFYNDQANLVAVSAKSNTSKGDKDPGRWRPSNRDTWCAYATAYVATKRTYRLAVDPAEQDALASMLATCAGER